ncbi:hypothetical protein JW935_06285 [candidate division KSB1 bacterium]|nr:hypothetical protein [candidate division KSB1 bacterium]
MTCLLAVRCTVSPNYVADNFDQIALLDVQGLWGGRDLWIAADGTAYSRVVVRPEEGQSGLQETRYQFKVSDQQISALHKLFRDHRFCSIHTEDRYGIPDEARPAIYIRAGTQACGVAKWANSQHQGFDSIYAFLLGIAENGLQGKQISYGTYNWQWKPPEFPDNQTIYEMTRPKL